MPIDPKSSCYSSSNKSPGHIIKAAALLSILSALATVWVVYDAWTSKQVITLYIAIGLWAVVPPFWFWLEYFYVYRTYGLPDTLELFKYGQDVSKAIWAGVLAGLVAFAASNATKPEPQKGQQSPPQHTSNP